jgi:release factor glutamine methyltransferase
VRAGGLRAAVVHDEERDATVVLGTVTPDCVFEPSQSAVTHPVTDRNR